MNELFSIYLEASGGKYGDQKGIFAVRDHVVAEMKAKLDRAERALKRAGYQEPEWKPPLGLSVQAIRNAWLDAEVVGNSWDGAKAVLDLINKKEISTGKAFQMEPGTMTQDKALDVVMAGVDQVEALARVLDKWHVCTPTDGHYAIENSEGIFGGWRSHDGLEEICEIHNAAIAHLAKRPEVSTKPVDLWAVITSIVDVRVDCDGCDYVEIDRTSVSDLEVALRPWLRDPVGFELDVHPDQLDLYKWVTEPDGGYAYAAQQAIDLCRSRISPTYECDCSAIEKERDLLKVEYESRQIMINNVRAALEGRPFKNTLEGE